jgi:hypothetical protein
MRNSPLLLASGTTPKPQDGKDFIHRDCIMRTTTILQRGFRIRAPIETANGVGTTHKGWAMTEQEQRLARARDEIASRVASFKATQEKFKREREEYFETTLENARNGSDGRTFWS